MPNFAGTWMHVKSENFSEYLKANGLNFLLASMMSKASPTLEIHQTGDEFVIRTITTMKTREQQFTVGQAFEEVHWSGGTKQSIAIFEGDKLVIKSVVDPENNPVIERELIGEDETELMMTLRKGDVVAKRYFKKRD
ncbi:cellular retinoic acid-binding protein 1-like [Saccoglossus kowalevskii]|uniref:Cellular retinoic acid-binding protein 1-like n=1 Tax=Saccoglossus kowalevskii TaxID=10224 RepID=A0ABM0MJQ4_SACKO|nr:PREDICTED: cellular retinoic acid-binding protein 1-like [Saccoglossus kowalevskii]